MLIRRLMMAIQSGHFVGFSAILDVVPNRSRGLAMSMSFFLNVALGAGYS